MRVWKRFFFFCSGMLLSCSFVNAQMLHTDGVRIVNDGGDEVLWRGIGLGGWMLQEGYMLNTSGPQHQIEAKVAAVIGEEKKNVFYDAWLSNHTRKIDVDSVAAWGYNLIRLPMHYQLFTPPIDEEPVAGEITWLDKGFAMTDSLLKWCAANQIYLILDMHAAPGGQGENADISDYDSSKPSLWESTANQEKMIALWRKLAERYADEPWIGAYDIINEPNWGFQDHESDPNGCAESENTALWTLEQQITSAIREVDQNHIIVIEGNCWGNNYSGLPDLWDDNMAISYHKYWNGNSQSDIQGILDMRTTRNVPIWLGESGENSNSWFTDCVSLLENNDIGWSWWPLKKLGNNNPMQIKMNDHYQAVVDYWNGAGEKPTEADAYVGLMQLAEDLKLEQTIFHQDVVDALIRQPHTNATLPFATHRVDSENGYILHFTDYDLGKVGVAYADEDYTNTTGSAGGQAWNLGYTYRNDGVDIEATSDVDEKGNGYSVGWTADGEWMQYTVIVDSSAAYRLTLRYAGGGTVHLEVDGHDVSGQVDLPATGSYTTWADLDLTNVVLYEGSHQLRLYIDNEGMNLNYLRFFLTSDLTDVHFGVISGSAHEDGSLLLVVNKELDSGSTFAPDDFSVMWNGNEVVPVSVGISDSSAFELQLMLDGWLIDGDEVRVSYTGDAVYATDGTFLDEFEDLELTNQAPDRYAIPGKIQAENYQVNNGMAAESTTDSGGGEDMGYSNAGDYLEYLINVQDSGIYQLEVRVACLNDAGQLHLQQLDVDAQVLHELAMDIPVTGGWQTWTTVTASMRLEAGPSTLKVVIVDPEFNLNWFNWVVPEKDEGDEVLAIRSPDLLRIFPNPVSGIVMIDLVNQEMNGPLEALLRDLSGKPVQKDTVILQNGKTQLDVRSLPSGMYILELQKDGKVMRHKLIVR